MSRYIATQEELEKLVADLDGSRILAIDTEFLREKTYYAKLCLIQLNNGQIQALVDPFGVDDLSVLGPILVDSGCVKIFHAGTQDIDILYHEVGVVPTPVFDTQVAASLLGHPLQVGYGPLVRDVCDVRLPKADGYTDWSRRPLTDNQTKYALDDVVYLPHLYEVLRHDLEEQGRLQWIEKDFEELSDPANYISEPREMWRKVKRVSTLNRRQLSIAREVTAWRETTAMRRDLPRKWVLPDEAVIEIARKAPKTRERLLEVRGLSGRLPERDVDEILEAVRKGGSLPQSQWPKLERAQHGDHEIVGAVSLMLSLVEMRAKENGVAEQLLAPHAELEKLARGHREGVSVLEGWRYEMVGRELVDLLEGRLALCVGKDGVEVTEKHQ